MKPSLTHNRDVLAGLLFIAIGAAGFAVALSYPFGNVQQMGPGFFPRILGLVLVAFGWLMEHVGMLPSLAVLTVVSASAGKDFRWSEALVLTVVMGALAWVIFIWGLGLPYPLVSFEFGR